VRKNHSVCLVADLAALRTRNRFTRSAAIAAAQIIALIGRGVPSADHPTAALASAPAPNCMAPARAAAAPARSGKTESAPEIALEATIVSSERTINKGTANPTIPPAPESPVVSNASPPIAPITCQAQQLIAATCEYNTTVDKRGRDHAKHVHAEQKAVVLRRHAEIVDVDKWGCSDKCGCAGDQPDSTRLGELLCGGAFQRVLQLEETAKKEGRTRHVANITRTAKKFEIAQQHGHRMGFVCGQIVRGLMRNGRGISASSLCVSWCGRRPPVRWSERFATLLNDLSELG
jgi:hypothetical protein